MWRNYSISDEFAVELARQVIKIETHFATSQDIEWVIDENNSIVFLQSRALLLRESDGHALEGEDLGKVLATGRVTASSGSAAGAVHIVNRREDVLKIPEGSVLVFKLPVPNWAIGIKRASAIVAEQGGVAGHFANVARELNVPALFGVRAAMQRFKPGEIITVDANRKKIFQGSLQEIIHKPKASQISIKSKGYKILEKASKHITPLNLLDPGDRTKFTPDNCKTFHDITRFCHEKSIQEMYNFGTKYNFPERSARCLYVDTPTQFWIIDLADGFKPDAPKGKYIKLKDIVSAPMQALWHGMTSIPWKMPQLDTRGFLEVLMESTMNTGLNYSTTSPYTKKNYFMVTRKYCSSHIHFGFHFSTVEALLGKRRAENYVRFNFTGGGAEEKRRHRRARLIADILEEYDFRINIVGDTLMARIEKYDLEVTKQRLEIVGYLMLHTRQLDMVLKNQDIVSQYKEKIREDLKIILKSSDAS